MRWVRSDPISYCSPRGAHSCHCVSVFPLSPALLSFLPSLLQDYIFPDRYIVEYAAPLGSKRSSVSPLSSLICNPSTDKLTSLSSINQPSLFTGRTRTLCEQGRVSPASARASL